MVHAITHQHFICVLYSIGTGSTVPSIFFFMNYRTVSLSVHSPWPMPAMSRFKMFWGLGQQASTWTRPTHQHVQPNVVSNCLSQHYLTEIVVVFPEAVKMAIIWPVLCPLHTTTARIHAEVSRHTKISEQPTANESKTRPHKSSSCEVRPRLYAL